MSIVYTSSDPYSITLTPVSSITPIGLTPISPYIPVDTVTLTPLNSIVVSSDENAPYKTSLNLTYSRPIIGVYENLNADPNIHKRLVKYYYLKTIEKWLYEDLIDVLNYVAIKDGKADIIKSMKEYNPVGVDKD